MHGALRIYTCSNHIISPLRGAEHGSMLSQTSTLRSSKTSHASRCIVVNFTEIVDNPSTSQAAPFWTLIAAKDSHICRFMSPICGDRAWGSAPPAIDITRLANQSIAPRRHQESPLDFGQTTDPILDSNRGLGFPISRPISGSPPTRPPDIILKLADSWPRLAPNKGTPGASMGCPRFPRNRGKSRTMLRRSSRPHFDSNRG